MNTLVCSAAYFYICPRCKKHGHIVLANGEESEEVASKKKALVLAKELTGGKIITADELPELERQIDVSVLPYENEGMDEELEMSADMRDSLEEILAAVHYLIDEEASVTDQDGNELASPRVLH